MNTATGHSHDAIASLHAAAINELVLIDHRHAKTSQVVAARAIEPRHFGGLSAEERTAALAAAVGDALHHFSHGLGRELPGGDVIQEKQRLSPACHHVVDAHRDEVNANPVVAAMGLGQLQLGPDPIGS